MKVLIAAFVTVFAIVSTPSLRADCGGPSGGCHHEPGDKGGSKGGDKGGKGGDKGDKGGKGGDKKGK